MLKKIIKLMAVIVAFSFMAGCGKNTPEPTATHHESGRYTLILSEIYGECMANNDIQGAKDALDMITKLSAFYCSYVNYDDVKNKNYNNFEFDVGNLQIAVAAYNEYNDESAMDVEVDWICHYDTCTSCGGTGRSGTSSSRRSSRNQATSDDWMSYLTPQEYAIVTEIKESMKPQRKYIPCKACKSTGTCQRCGGIQTALDLDAPFHCPQCGGSGYCIACNGKGNQGYMVVDPPNYKYLQQRLAYYCKIATNRQLGYK